MVIIKRDRERHAAGFRLVFGYFCVFLGYVGGITLLPLIMLLAYPDEWICFPAFLIPGGSALLIGGILAPILMKGRQKGKLEKFQDSVLLVSIWIGAILVGTFPFFLADKVDFFGGNNGALSMNFSESFFESMSGFSACGFTVMHGLASNGAPVYSNFLDCELSYCPHIFLFYRALTQFFGGVGLVLVVASAVSDRFGMQLFATEGHNDRLLPNLGKTAKATFGIYSLIIAVGTISMWLFGMDLFEAFCHSVAGMATGGFSTRVNGFYNYTNAHPIFGTVNAVGIEITVDVIMILGATSFLLIYNALTLKWKKAFRDCEVRLMAILLLVATLAGWFLISRSFTSGQISPATSLRYSSFQMISCLTTTGFGNSPGIVNLGQGVIFISIILMLVGGGMGSTAGAIKQFRVVVALKSVWWSVRYKFSPSRLVYPHNVVRAGKNLEITDEIYRDNTLYIILYLLVVGVFTFILVLLPINPQANYSFQEALYLVSSSLSGTGNTIVDFLNDVRVPFFAAGASLWPYYVVLWIMSACMILGRLEILPLYYALRRVNRIILRRQIV